jgi:hypothetical protein
MEKHIAAPLWGDGADIDNNRIPQTREPSFTPSVMSIDPVHPSRVVSHGLMTRDFTARILHPNDCLSLADYEPSSESADPQRR